jgi:hypothetical protein
VDRETDGVDGVVVDGRPVPGGPVGPAGAGGPAGRGDGDPAAARRLDGPRATGGADGPVIRLLPGGPERPDGPDAARPVPGTGAAGPAQNVEPVGAIGPADAVEPVDPLTGAAADGSGAAGGTVYRAACPDCRSRFELGPAALRLAIGATRRTTF